MHCVKKYQNSKIGSNIPRTNLKAKIKQPIPISYQILLRKIYHATNLEELIRYLVTALEIHRTEKMSKIPLNIILEKQTNYSQILELFFNDFIAI